MTCGSELDFAALVCSTQTFPKLSLAEKDNENRSTVFSVEIGREFLLQSCKVFLITGNVDFLLGL